MSNALTVYEPNTFAALDQSSAAAQALIVNMAGEDYSDADLTRVKTPSGGQLFWTIEGVSGVETTPEIEGILVFVASQGILWPTLDAVEGTKPVLITRDLKTARSPASLTRDDDGKIEEIEGVDDQTMIDVLNDLEIRTDDGKPTGVWNWESLPYTQFGSGKDGNGKFAKEGRLLFILRKTEVLPLVIRCGPSAIGSIRKMILHLPAPHYRCVVGVGLKEEKSAAGQKYSLPVPRLKGLISEEEGSVIEKMYTSKLRRAYNSGAVNVVDSE